MLALSWSSSSISVCSRGLVVTSAKGKTAEEILENALDTVGVKSGAVDTAGSDGNHISFLLGRSCGRRGSCGGSCVLCRTVMELRRTLDEGRGKGTCGRLMMRLIRRALSTGGVGGLYTILGSHFRGGQVARKGYWDLGR